MTKSAEIRLLRNVKPIPCDVFSSLAYCRMPLIRIKFALYPQAICQGHPLFKQVVAGAGTACVTHGFAPCIVCGVGLQFIILNAEFINFNAEFII